MKLLENWCIKINDKNHEYEVVKTLKELGYDLRFYKVDYRPMYYTNFSRTFSRTVGNIVVSPTTPNLKQYTLEEFVEAHNVFKAMKFRVSSKEEYNKLLNHLFDLGYYKNMNDVHLGNYIFTSTKGLVYGIFADNETDALIYFNNHESPEYTLKEITSYELKEVVKVYCKNCGKEINMNSKNHFDFSNGSHLCWECYKEVERACWPF